MDWLGPGVSLLVTDYDVAVEFYCDRTRLFEIYAHGNFGTSRNVILKHRVYPFSLLLVRIEPAALAQIQFLVREHADQAAGLVLPVDDCKTEYERLLRAGIEFPAGMYDLPWARQAGFTDPFGNEINLEESYLTGTDERDGANR